MRNRPSNQIETQQLIDLLHKLASKLAPRTIRIMEVCGTHTVTAQACGLHSLLPDNVTLISGPGCPVCVTPAGYIQQAVELAMQENTHIVSYGDMIRVPGAPMSLEDARRNGGQVSVIYSIHDALTIARREKKTNVIFLGIGFETTTPATALALKFARTEGLKNFLVLPAHKIIVPAMEILLEDPELAIDGFIAPGHVSVIIGTHAYRAMVEKYQRPCVVAGFDAQQMLMAIVQILTQLVHKEPKVETVYRDRVKPDGNLQAQTILGECFIRSDADWRGLGTIKNSGLRIHAKFADFDATKVFGLGEPQNNEPPGCQCGEVIKGKIPPPACPLFRLRCTPETPVGPCMVSREGTCSAYYRYRRREKNHE